MERRALELYKGYNPIVGCFAPFPTKVRGGFQTYKFIPIELNLVLKVINGTNYGIQMFFVIPQPKMVVSKVNVLITKLWLPF